MNPDDFNLELPADSTGPSRDFRERRSPPDRKKLEDLGKVQYLKRQFDMFCLSICSSKVGKAACLLAALLSIGLLVWSHQVRLGKIALVDTRVAERDDLQYEFDALLRQWQAEKYQQLHAEVDDYYRHIFPDYRKLADWIEEQTVAASDMGMEMSYVMSNPVVVERMNDIVEVRLNMRLKRDGLPADRTYVGSLSFLQMLLKEDWRLDFKSVRMRADDTGVDEVEANISLWIRQNRKPVEPESMASQIAANE